MLVQRQLIPSRASTESSCRGFPELGIPREGWAALGAEHKPERGIQVVRQVQGAAEAVTAKPQVHQAGLPSSSCNLTHCSKLSSTTVPPLPSLPWAREPVAQLVLIGHSLREGTAEASTVGKFTGSQVAQVGRDLPEVVLHNPLQVAGTAPTR